jgi:hypothetical protein
VRSHLRQAAIPLVPVGVPIAIPSATSPSGLAAYPCDISAPFDAGWVSDTTVRGSGTVAKTETIRLPSRVPFPSVRMPPFLGSANARLFTSELQGGP